MRACVEGQRALAAHHWRDPQARPKVRMGLHSGHAVAGRRRVRHPRGAPRGPGRGGRPRRAGAAVGGHRTPGRPTCPRTPRCSTSASTSCAASTAGSGCSSSSPTGLERVFPRPRTLAAAAHNLPASPSSFVGRQVEREELGGLVASRRLVNVVGPGGAGKTRLAIEVAGGMVAVVPRRRLVRRSRRGHRPVPHRRRRRRGARCPPRAGPHRSWTRWSTSSRRGRCCSCSTPPTRSSRRSSRWSTRLVGAGAGCAGAGDEPRAAGRAGRARVADPAHGHDPGLRVARPPTRWRCCSTGPPPPAAAGSPAPRSCRTCCGSRSGSTVCRSRWSWPRPGCGSSPRASSPTGSRICSARST